MDNFTTGTVLQSYVHDVLVLENKDSEQNAHLPFYADGYPGIIFQNAANGIFLKPHNKKASAFFLYGQTIEPIEMIIAGTYKIIVFQLYPFAARILLGIEPKEITDDCFDLTQMPESIAKSTLHQLSQTEDTQEQMDLIAVFLKKCIQKSPINPDESILLTINLILQFKGKISIRNLREKIHITERTFERRFLKEIGVNPKNFARIIQFQSSKNQLSKSDDSNTMDVVFENGFTDQSHFIKTFKKYTGLTPSEFQHSLDLKME